MDSAGDSQPPPSSDAGESSSNTNVGMLDLSPDILESLFCWLPVKSLLTYRTVSKRLRSMIDSQHFIDLHLKNTLETRSHRFLIVGRNPVINSINFDDRSDAVELASPLMSHRNRLLVLGSVNGLVCISNSDKEIALWNPSIRRHKILPVLPVEQDFEWGPIFPISRVFGFGYDPMKEEYKLVRISQFTVLGEEQTMRKVKVYSQRAHKWRDSVDMPYVCMNEMNGIFVNEALHWVVKRKYKASEPDLITAFNLTDEIFSEVPLPEFKGGGFRIELGVLSECLCMVAIYGEVVADIWIMGEYGVKESWAKVFSIAAVEFIGTIRSLKPLCYSKTGGEVLLEHDQRRLVWYDLRNRRIRIFRVRGLPNWFEAELYIESLVPVEASRGEERDFERGEMQ